MNDRRAQNKIKKLLRIQKTSWKIGPKGVFTVPKNGLYEVSFTWWTKAGLANKNSKLLLPPGTVIKLVADDSEVK